MGYHAALFLKTVFLYLTDLSTTTENKKGKNQLSSNTYIKEYWQESTIQKNIKKNLENYTNTSIYIGILYNNMDDNNAADGDAYLQP